MRNVIPALLFVFGAIWLLHGIGWIPDARWLTILAPCIVGITLFAFKGVTKMTVIVSPILLLVGLMIFLQDMAGVDRSLTMPVILMAAGVLIVVSRLPSIPRTDRSGFRSRSRRIDTRVMDESPASHLGKHDHARSHKDVASTADVEHPSSIMQAGEQRD